MLTNCKEVKINKKIYTYLLVGIYFYFATHFMNNLNLESIRIMCDVS